ncbi:MAG: T9SS type A sorting domain-containing protein, partial [Flavobacteriaceae bacterium]|nr:T9SS type A sorting domain-containing protein [Flavobacteriaceae bacterium]
GNPVASTTVNIPAGQSLVTVNFNIPKGDGYTISIPSGLVNMRRTPIGNGVAFPYTSPSGVVSIVDNTVDDPNYYYFFYDWNISTSGGRCESVRTPVNVTVNADNPDLSDGDTTYQINSGAVTNFNDGTTINVAPGANVDLDLPASAFSGTLVWTAPDLSTFTTNSVNLPSIVDAGPYEGNWTVAITFTPNCGTSPQVVNFAINVDPLLSIDDNEFNDLRVYPNPTDANIYITSSNNLENVSVSIVDISGRRLQNNFSPTQISPNELSLDMSQLATGTYFLILNDDQNRSVRTIIKN